MGLLLVPKTVPVCDGLLVVKPVYQQQHQVRLHFFMVMVIIDKLRKCWLEKKGNCFWGRGVFYVTFT